MLGDWEEADTGPGEQAETEARSPSTELEGALFPREVPKLYSFLDSSSNRARAE